MPPTILWSELGQRPFEFQSPINLDNLHRPDEAAGHSRA